MKRIIVGGFLAAASAISFAQSNTGHGFVSTEYGTGVSTSSGCLTVDHPTSNTPIGCSDKAQKAQDDVVDYSAPPAQERPIKSYIGGRTVLFEYNSSEVAPEAEKIINELTERFPNGEVKIIAGADVIGGAEYNKKLSQQRADNIKYILSTKGLYDFRSSIGVGNEYATQQKTKACAKVKHNKKKFIQCIGGDRRALILIKSAVNPNQEDAPK